MPDFPSTTDTPPMESRIIPRILPEDFNVPNKETLDLIMNFEESQGRFNRRREFETSAQPKCNGEALQLNLECEGCHVGFPKLDLCVRFSREDSLRDESEFKVSHSLFHLARIKAREEFVVCAASERNLRRLDFKAILEKNTSKPGALINILLGLTKIKNQTSTVF